VRHRPGGPPVLDGLSLFPPPGQRTVPLGAGSSGTSTLIATRDRTTLLVTHNREALTGADRVIRLDRGRILG
jgi:ABC-type transport system involved in cytochrome bd biosynthesis fused ATPase/permease subunit